MSKVLTTTYSLRRHIQPIIETDEEDDDQRRNLYGRKRVDVIECLLDSSSEELDNGNVSIQRINRILWLTLEEIRHIRYVITQTSLSWDKQCSQIRRGYLCFRCRKRICAHFFFLPSFLRSNNQESCFICQQVICKTCAYAHFLPPPSKLLIPVRMQLLIKPSSTTIANKTNKSNTQTKTVCFDCLQIFNEHIKTSHHPITPLRRTSSLPPMSSQNLNAARYTRHRCPSPLQSKKPI